MSNNMDESSFHFARHDQKNKIINRAASILVSDMINAGLIDQEDRVIYYEDIIIPEISKIFDNIASSESGGRSVYVESFDALIEGIFDMSFMGNSVIPRKKETFDQKAIDFVREFAMYIYDTENIEMIQKVFSLDPTRRIKFIENMLRKIQDTGFSNYHNEEFSYIASLTPVQRSNLVNQAI